MFENMTYDAILSDMLTRVTNDVDKRVGSVIYDALGPCAYYLAQAYYNLDIYVDMFFGITAEGEYLDKKVADYGITRKAATYAVRKINTTGVIDIGTRWGIDGIAYEITDIITSGSVYEGTCETAGEIGNTYTGELENIDNVPSVTATLGDAIVEGSDEETDTDLRSRMFSLVQNPATSGNKNHYIAWAKEVPGIGYAIVTPRWDGINTVKLTLLTDSKETVSPAKLTEVAEYIEERRPPGADVTVVSAAEKSIDIRVGITLANGSTEEEALSDIIENITQYFYDITFIESIVRYVKIGEAILSSDNIIDYENLTINNLTGNIQLATGEFPVLGAITLL